MVLDRHLWLTLTELKDLESKLSDSSSPSINKKKESSKESKDVGVVYL